MTFEEAQQKLRHEDQLHLLNFWDQLPDARKSALLDDIACIDWQTLGTIQSGGDYREGPAPDAPEPPEVHEAHSAFEDRFARERELGEQLLRANQVGALTLAGGQGTRLGFSGPKGTFPITPVKCKPLFQHLAEQVLASRRRYDCQIPWFIMTGPDNHEETIAFFEKHDYYNLDPRTVTFFQQGVMPALDAQGKVLLADRHRIAMAPDGHGGTFRALYRSGALDHMRTADIRYISCFQVDNPLIHAVDPLFVGLVARKNSELGSKAVRKADDFEKVGFFAQIREKLQIIEYSDAPPELCRRRNEDGARTFDFANIAAHVFDVDLIARMATDLGKDGMPWHRAKKKVPHVDPQNAETIEPEQPNAVKLEQFIFDAIPRARNPVILEVRRAEEFSPVKNAEGTDSPQTCRRHQIERAVRWLALCDVDPHLLRTNGRLKEIEISPLYALDVGHLRERLTPEELDTTEPIYLGN